MGWTSSQHWAEDSLSELTENGSTSISVKNCLCASGISSQYSQPKVSHVTIAISHPLYGLNPVLLPFHKTVGYPVVKVVQELLSPVPECV